MKVLTRLIQQQPSPRKCEGEDEGASEPHAVLDQKEVEIDGSRDRNNHKTHERRRGATRGGLDNEKGERGHQPGCLGSAKTEPPDEPS